MNQTLNGVISASLSLNGNINNAIKYIQPITQEKRVKPNENIQEIMADNGFNGLSKVVVEAIPEKYIIPSGSLPITTNGIHDVTQYASVTVEIGENENEETYGTTLGKLITGEGIFKSCSNLTKIVFTNLNSPNITTAKNMFDSCKNLTEAYCDNWTAPKLTTLSLMFQYCSNLKKIDFSGSKLTSVTATNSMFYDCASLIEANLSGIYISGNSNCARMFSNCSKLQKIDIRSIKLTDITTSSNYSSMFNAVPTSCEIIVMDDACKTWMNTKFSSYKNVKTVAELG